MGKNTKSKGTPPPANPPANTEEADRLAKEAAAAEEAAGIAKAKEAAAAEADRIAKEKADALEADRIASEKLAAEHGLVTARVVGQSVSEEGQRYSKGETLLLSIARAAALGELVEVVTAD